MNSTKYPIYVALVLGAAALALWAGLPPLVLFFLLMCPLMMLFMMRGVTHGRDARPETRGVEQSKPKHDPVGRGGLD